MFNGLRSITFRQIALIRGLLFSSASVVRLMSTTFQFSNTLYMQDWWSMWNILSPMAEILCKMLFWKIICHLTIAKLTLWGRVTHEHWWSNSGNMIFADCGEHNDLLLPYTAHISTGLTLPLLWRHNGHHGVSNHQLHDCLLNRLFRRRSKQTSKLRVTGLCVGNSPVNGEFPAQMASNAENVSIWWRHHVSVVQIS